MSDESSSSKNHEPTEHKIRKSREQGQVAQSKDVTLVGAILIVSLYLFFSYDILLKDFVGFHDAIRMIIFTQSDEIDIKSLHMAVFSAFWVIVKHVGIPIVCAAIFSFIVNAFQIGGIMISKKSIVDFNNLNPINTVKNLFSKRTLLKFIKNVIEVSVLVGIGVWMAYNSLHDILIFPYTTLSNLVLIAGYIVIKCVLLMIIIYFIFGLVDLVIEKMHLKKQLMMSDEDLKQEMKETEGNIEMKYKRRHMHQEAMEEGGFGSMIDPDHSIVVSNPTHLAILIYYHPIKWKIPIVLLKTKNYQANIILTIAKKKKMLIIPDKWLAWQLYNLADLGQFIPSILVEYVGNLIGKNLIYLPKILEELIYLQNLEAQNKLNKNKVVADNKVQNLPINDNTAQDGYSPNSQDHPVPKYGFSNPTTHPNTRRIMPTKQHIASVN